MIRVFRLIKGFGWSAMSQAVRVKPRSIAYRMGCNCFWCRVEQWINTVGAGLPTELLQPCNTWRGQGCSSHRRRGEVTLRGVTGFRWIRTTCHPANADGGSLRVPTSRRIIKGRPFAVASECDPELYRKGHPYER